MEELRGQARAEVEKILTQEQLGKLKELLGAPFKLEMPAGFGPGRGAGPGPGMVRVQARVGKGRVEVARVPVAVVGAKLDRNGDEAGRGLGACWILGFRQRLAQR